MLKLAKLPDRTPVKITVTLNPDLHRMLRDYAALYRAEYGEGESIADLIPYMLASFLDGDRAFAKARKTDAPPTTDDLPPEKHRGPGEEGRGDRAGTASNPADVTITLPGDTTMSIIGTFTPAKDGGWAGSIRTLILDTKLRLVPNDNRDSDNAPAFRVLAGNSRVGDAWEARTTGDNPKPYWRVRLDDPALPASFTAALFPSDDGASAQLVWNRR